MTDLVSAGIVVAPVVLHAGVSSPEADEPPAPERFEVSEATAALVEHTRAAAVASSPSGRRWFVRSSPR